ncbi:MAG: class IV adenylate cyclase [Candidatus Aenigmatarchaeota archaeon]
MPEELEVMILEINKDEIIKKLESLGAERIRDVRMKIKMFDYPDERLRKEISFLRLRDEGDRSVLTFKKMKHQEGVKCMDEFETKVSDPDAIEKLLKAIGLVATRHQEKDRVTFKKDGITFNVDEWPGAPPLLEIEAETMDKVRQGVEMLGFKMEDTCAIGGREFFEKYGLVERAHDLKFE